MDNHALSRRDAGGDVRRYGGISGASEPLPATDGSAWRFCPCTLRVCWELMSGTDGTPVRVGRDDTPFLLTLSEHTRNRPRSYGAIPERACGMTVSLANGGTVTVLESGTVEFRQGERVFRTDGKGFFPATVAWVESLAYGDDVRYITHKG